MQRLETPAKPLGGVGTARTRMHVPIIRPQLQPHSSERPLLRGLFVCQYLVPTKMTCAITGTQEPTKHLGATATAVTHTTAAFHDLLKGGAVIRNGKAAIRD